MVAVLGGLGAALAWATATLCATRATRLIGTPSVLAWVMLTGLAVTVPWAAVKGVPSLGREALGLLLVAGFGNTIGLLFAYSGFKIGKVGIVAPIVSTEGAIAAVIAVVAGERLAPGTGPVLVVVAGGIVLAAMGRDSADADSAPRASRAGLFGLAAALSFGVSLYATGRLSSELPVAWAVLPPRIVGVLLIALPLAVTARLVLTREAAPLVLVAGAAEVVGFASFALGARHGIAVSAVLASQFAAVAAVAAYFVFGERLTRAQLVGVVAIASGVAVLSALQA
jgi:drug/metabolite transporter (DMT)-like permease